VVAAREMFLRAVAIDPAFAHAWTGLANASAWLYQWRGRHAEHLQESLDASARALALRPDLAESHGARGYALSLAGQPKEAEQEFEAAVARNPELFDAHYFHARVCLEQGRLADAARHFERAAQTRPEDYQSRALMAMALRGLGQNDRAHEMGLEAIEQASRHLERNPDDVRANYMLGIELINEREIERGLEYLARARQLDPLDGGTLYNVACGYARAGKTEEALDLLAESIDRAVANRDWIVNDPDWADLRDHPRFQALLERLR
jgi:adenylate cyclase